MPDASHPQDWYRYCRIMLEWLHPKRALDPEPWVEEVVARAANLKVDTLLFDMYHGGYAVFDNAVAPKDRHIGQADVLALLDEAVHRRGMRFALMNMGAHAAHYTALEYPAWRERDATGSAETPPGHVTPQMCLNSPYASFLRQELSGVLARYRIDALYVEGIDGQDCYCDTCCTAFERTYEYPIPRQAAVRMRDPNYRAFRTGVTTNFVRMLRGVIDAASPTTVLMPCPGPRPVENAYVDYAAWGRYADAITHERMWGFGRDHERACKPALWELGLSMQVSRAESGRPAMGTVWLGWHVDRDYAPSTASHYRLNFAEILLYGATPQLHAQTVFEVDASEMSTVREMFGKVQALRPALLDAHLVPYAALVVDTGDFRVSADAKGVYQALIENHVPFEVISSRALTGDDLHRYRVLILPNVVRLSNVQVRAVEAFHASGGGVVLTFRTGCEQDDGTVRPQTPFADMAGIRGPFAVVTAPAGTATESLPVTYYRVTAEHAVGAGQQGRLQSYRGSFVELEAADADVIAQALDHDFSRLHRHHPAMGWYPGNTRAPFVLTRTPSGAGRVVVFAAEFGRECYELGLPGPMTMLAQGTVWAAAAPPPVEVSAPPTVEVATHVSPGTGTYTVLLVNRTSNQLGSGMVVRHVVRLTELTLVLRNMSGAVHNVRSLAGSEVAWETADDECRVTLSGLDEYDAVLVET